MLIKGDHDSLVANALSCCVSSAPDKISRLMRSKDVGRSNAYSARSVVGQAGTVCRCSLSM